MDANAKAMEDEAKLLEARRLDRVKANAGKSDEVQAAAVVVGDRRYYRASQDCHAHGELIKQGQVFSIDAAHRPSSTWQPLTSAPADARRVNPLPSCGSCKRGG